MNKNKFNLRNVVAVAICLVGLMAFVGCENKDNYEYEEENPNFNPNCENKGNPVEENLLVGSWAAAGNHNDPNHIIDGRTTIHFTECFGFGTTGGGAVHPGSVSTTYFLSETKLTIIIECSFLDSRSCWTFEYALSDNSLTIKHFSRYLTPFAQKITDVHFRRIE